MVGHCPAQTLKTKFWMIKFYYSEVSRIMYHTSQVWEFSK